jgi:hypothetical protein
MPAKKIFITTITVLFIGFVLIQFVHPTISQSKATAEIQAPAQVKAILQRACYDCHSNQTNLRWYDQIQPAYWLVAAHVKEGRKDLNFSDWKNLAKPDQQGKLWEAVNQIAEGAMPIKSYELLHPSTKVSDADLQVLKNYLLTMVNNKPADTFKTNALQKQYLQLQKPQTATALPTALNGITYIPDYKNWQAISTTDRFDNSTMRVIFGNPVAVQAIKDGHTNPWPNGTIFAKVAWDKLTEKNGDTKTGAFKQIEYMIKDDQKYASTKGWGFARFKTPKMVPYGKNVMFATECVNCHRPMKDNDFVFTEPIKF